jgi:hypothetical protein
MAAMHATCPTHMILDLITQRVMAAKLTRMTQQNSDTTAPFAVLAPSGQSGNFWIHPRRSCSRSVSIGARLRAGRSGFISRRGKSYDIFLFATASRLAVGPTQRRIWWVPGALYPRVKRPVRGAIPPFSQYVLMDLCLIMSSWHGT